MDPATSDPLHSAVEIQGAMLGRHKQELSAARHAVETLATQVSNLTEQVHHLRLDPPATSRAFESPEPRINNPPCYSGEPTECRSFLTQCDIVFSLQPNTYSRSTARVAYVISLLIGRAREWGTAIWEARAECTNQYQDFKEEMIRVFDRSVFGEEASRALSSLCQGNRSITDYSIEFRTLAVSSGWNEPALLARLLEGFRAEVKDEILSREVPSSVDSLIELAIRIERRVDLRHRARGKELALSVASLSASLPSSSAGSGAEPMQLGGIRISTEERERRITNRLCLYCGSAGHFVTSCPVKGQSSSVSGGLLVSATTPVSPSRSCTTLSVHLRWTGSSASCSALIDSGAEGCFMDETWAREHDIPLRQLKEPTALFALDGSPLPRIQRETLPLTLTVSGNHSETISFLIFRSPFTPVVLGHPGVRGTLASIRQRFWWPTREHDRRRFVAACSVCAQTKSGNSPPAGRLRPLPIPSRPWSHIALDFVTGLPSSAGKTVILTVVDRFSKAAHFIPLAKLPSAKETAQIIIENVFRIHGLPSDVVSDRGPQFTSQFWREFCRLIGASVSLSSGFHPQSNGQAERANQTIGRILRSLSFRNPASWSEQLPWAEYAHNSLPSSATGLSPFQSSLGYQPPLFSSQFAESSVPSAQAFVQRCERTWKRVRSALCRYRAQTVRAANKRRTKSPRYCRGQRVWLSTQNLPLKTASRKLTPRFIGPFRISQVINPVAVRLLLPRYLRRVHPVFHVSCVKPVLRAPARLPPPPPHPCRGRTYLQGP
uniref:Gypsy retrotransposon integrase-like protein 1 n=1 Tax=Oncorhynchus mykiss TaxID=8022 RepID=A0A8K9XXP6_ONCMY